MLRDRLDEGNIADVGKTTVRLGLGGVDVDHRMLGDSFFHIGGASYGNLISTQRHRRLMSNYLWDTYLGGVAGRLVNDL